MSGNTILTDGRTSETATITGNRLDVNSVNTSRSVNATRNGDSYFASSGIATLTSDNQSAIFYIKNTDSVPWVIESLFGIYGQSTGGTGDAVSYFSANITGGTILTSGFPTIAGTINSGSAKQLSGDFIIGFEGATTEGAFDAPSLLPAGTTTRRFVEPSFITAPDTSFTMQYKPPSGNTFQQVMIEIILYRLI